MESKSISFNTRNQSPACLRNLYSLNTRQVEGPLNALTAFCKIVFLCSNTFDAFSELNHLTHSRQSRPERPTPLIRIRLCFR